MSRLKDNFIDNKMFGLSECYKNSIVRQMNQEIKIQLFDEGISKV